MKYFTFYLFGEGCVRTQRTPLPTGLQVFVSREGSDLARYIKRERLTIAKEVFYTYQIYMSDISSELPNGPHISLF